MSLVSLTKFLQEENKDPNKRNRCGGIWDRIVKSEYKIKFKGVCYFGNDCNSPKAIEVVTNKNDYIFYIYKNVDGVVVINRVLAKCENIFVASDAAATAFNKYFNSNNRNDINHLLDLLRSRGLDAFV